MRTGVVTPSISRLGGGLFESVRALSVGVQQLGVHTDVFSSNDAFAKEDSAVWEGLTVHLFNYFGPRAFGYSRGLRAAMDSANLDLVHCHGIWMYPSIAAHGWSLRSRRPVIVSPHGMLDPWAVKNSAWKKRLAGCLYENANLRSVACIRALCDSEYKSIRAYGLSNPVAVVPNGIHLPVVQQDWPEPEWYKGLPDGSRVLLFLGRIHPKKGLPGLIQAWAKFKSDNSPSVSVWHLVIAGWDQGGHESELKKIAAETGSSSSIHFIGSQYGDEKEACLAKSDAFVLPSFSEGLPMSVLEAWANGLPSLLTDQCNLPEGFSSGAAIRIETSPESICEGLRKLADLNEKEFRELGERGSQLVKNRFTWPSVSSSMLDVYEWVVNGGSLPNCVRLN